MATTSVAQLSDKDSAATQSASWPIALTILTVFCGIMLAVNTYMAFIYAPTEATMGAVQRIFYFHVGAAWAGAVGFITVLVAGIAYLTTRNHTWDIVSHASVEVGIALVTIAIVGGMIWAQWAWGAPWTWDPKLTSAAVMWLSYAAYLMLRRGFENPEQRARFAAVYGIVAFASVIMTYYGARFIESTIHPYVVGGSSGVAEGDFGLSARMTTALMFSFATFTVVFFTLMWHRMRLERLTERVEALKMKMWMRQLEVGE